MTEKATIDAIKKLVSSAVVSEFRGDTRVVIPPTALHRVMLMLRNDRRFDLLVDVSCVDYLNYRDATDRFGLVYLLANTTSNERITIRTFLNEPNLTIPSVVPLWPGANWLEREVWDMYGINFDGHPDLRRILMPEEFTAFPLRKDYPMQGRGERHNFPVLARNSG